MILLGFSGGKHYSDQDGALLISKNNIDAMELPFTYQVWLNDSQSEDLGLLMKKHNIRLSIHAPYWINLASEDKKKIAKSKSLILASAERGYYMHATEIVFHAAFYGKRSKEETYGLVKESILDMQQKIKENHWNISLAPETTGKASQFGDLDELIRLHKETGCHFCIDFSHIKARYNGKIDYDDIMKKLKPIKFHLHAHFSGIEFTQKGERRHIPTKKEEIKELLMHIKKHNLSITIINEAPKPFDDAVMTKKILDSL